jgi:hypothetical protein
VIVNHRRSTTIDHSSSTWQNSRSSSRRVMRRSSWPGDALANLQLSAYDRISGTHKVGVSEPFVHGTLTARRGGTFTSTKRIERLRQVLGPLLLRRTTRGRMNQPGVLINPMRSSGIGANHARVPLSKVVPLTPREVDLDGNQ